MNHTSTLSQKVYQEKQPSFSAIFWREVYVVYVNTLCLYSKPHVDQIILYFKSIFDKQYMCETSSVLSNFFLNGGGGSKIRQCMTHEHSLGSFVFILLYFLYF